MLHTGKEKANSFLKAINRYAEEQRNQIKNELNLFRQAELERVESEVLSDAYTLIQKEMSQMRSSIASEISRREFEGRKTLFQKRTKITDEVFEKAKQKLIEFTQTDEYISLLEKYASLISKTLNKNGTVLYVRKQDLEYAERIKKAYDKDCSVKASDTIEIGGIYGVNTKMGVIADESLDSKLQNQHEWFAENSGMSLV